MQNLLAESLEIIKFDISWLVSLCFRLFLGLLLVFILMFGVRVKIEDFLSRDPSCYSLDR